MTNKTINGVPRWMLVILADPHSPYDQLMSAKEHARALLAAPGPIVEADGIGEPVGLVSYIGNGFIRVRGSVPPKLETLLYSADQLAALQSTIAQLKAENEALRRGMVGDYDLDAWLEFATAATKPGERDD